MDINTVSLKFNGRNSTEFGARVIYPFNLVHAKRDLSSTSIPGVSGNYIIDNKKYSDISQQITFIVERPTFYQTWEELEFDFEDWLFPQTDYTEYQPFYFDFLEPYHWLAYMSDAPVWTITDATTAQVVVSLTCKPYLVYGETEFEDVPSIITNTERISASPVWHIVGDGAVTLTINDKDYKLTNIDGEIYIDCTRFLVYKSLTEFRGVVAQFPNHEYPILNPGENTVSLSGKYSKFEYKPNWRRLV